MHSLFLVTSSLGPPAVRVRPRRSAVAAETATATGDVQSEHGDGLGAKYEMLTQQTPTTSCLYT